MSPVNTWCVECSQFFTPCSCATLVYTFRHLCVQHFKYQCVVVLIFVHMPREVFPTHVCARSTKGRPSLSLDPSVTTFRPPQIGPGLTEIPAETSQQYLPFKYSILLHFYLFPYFFCRRILSGNKYILVTIYSYKYLTELAFVFFRVV